MNTACIVHYYLWLVRGNTVIHSTGKSQSCRHPGLNSERYRVVWLLPSKALEAHVYGLCNWYFVKRCIKTKPMTKAFAEGTPECSGPPISDEGTRLVAKLFAGTDLLLIPVFALILFYHKWESFFIAVLKIAVCDVPPMYPFLTLKVLILTWTHI